MITSPGDTRSAVDIQICDSIHHALIVKRMNVRALSDQTGISYQTLRRSLAAGRSFTFREFGSIANALNVPPAALLPETLTGNAA